MPLLPWKKTGVNRISRIVADLHSPKRGNSLVVETGFPTSLADLFVKNRDRLRKSSKKKKKKKSGSDLDSTIDVRLTDEITSRSRLVSENSRVRGVGFGSNCCQVKNSTRSTQEEEEASHGGGGGRSGFGFVGKAGNPNRVFVGAFDDVDGDNESACADTRSVFFAAFKVFLMVVLALSTKQLAFGITLSAFVLLFLEYLGKRLVCFFKPCSNAKVKLNSMIRWVLTLFWFKNSSLVQKDFDEGENPNALMAESVDGLKSNYCSMEEIELLEPIIEKHEEISSTVPELQFSSHDMKLGSLDKDKNTKAVEESEVLVEKSKHTSKRSKLKAKIKRLVPRRLRGSSKSKKGKGHDHDHDQQESSNEVFFTPFEDEKLGKSKEEKEQHLGNQQGQESENQNILVFCSQTHVERKKEEEKKEEVDGGTSGFDEQSWGGKQVSMLDVKEGKGKKGNLGYPILFLIGLAGLVGGRIVALLLTIAWCLISKLIGTQIRGINMTLLRSSVTITS